jgi:ABC-type multidrug transport system ATPase subunit
VKCFWVGLLQAIEANNIQKRFGDISVLHDISFRLGRGETIVLLGPNGAGKSTLLKIVASLYKPSKGSVKLFGYELSQDSDKARKIISFLGENYALYDDLTVRKNLEFFGRLYDIDDKILAKRIVHWLKKFDAIQYLDRNVGELSRGTKQKVALCRALINEPQLLLLDEPSAFLDPVASKMLHSELNALSRKGVSIMYATQRLDELYKIGNKTLLLRKGKNIAFGSVDRIINRLRDVEVEILMSRPISKQMFAALNKRWSMKYGDSERSVIFSLNRINDIPKVVKDVVRMNGKIISVLYLKESIDKILQGD